MPGDGGKCPPLASAPAAPPPPRAVALDLPLLPERERPLGPLLGPLRFPVPLGGRLPLPLPLVVLLWWLLEDGGRLFNVRLLPERLRERLPGRLPTLPLLAPLGGRPSLCGSGPVGGNFVVGGDVVAACAAADDGCDAAGSSRCFLGLCFFFVGVLFFEDFRPLGGRPPLPVFASLLPPFLPPDCCCCCCCCCCRRAASTSLAWAASHMASSSSNFRNSSASSFAISSASFAARSASTAARFSAASFSMTFCSSWPTVRANSGSDFIASCTRSSCATIVVCWCG